MELTRRWKEIFEKFCIGCSNTFDLEIQWWQETVSYCDMELHRGEIFIAVTVLVLNRFEQKVIITRNNDRDLNEYASISILQTYPFSNWFFFRIPNFHAKS